MPFLTAKASQRRADLPIHFFTIVLNGEPFIRYHLDVLRELPFRWHWHVVEGVASLVHDTAWSLAGDGHVDPGAHEGGLSIDGTTAYLDEIAAADPDRISVYRPPEGFWDGKREMVSAPLANIREECLLWQVDADELWTAEQIARMRDLFIEQPERTAAYYWCDYFVGPRSGSDDALQLRTESDAGLAPHMAFPAGRSLGSARAADARPAATSVGSTSARLGRSGTTRPSAREPSSSTSRM